MITGLTSVILVTLLSVIYALPCCDHVKQHKDCHRVCVQVSKSKNHNEQVQRLAKVAHQCPSNLEIFWQCVNHSFVSGEAAQWIGRPCCDLTIAPRCKTACIQAKSKDAVENLCTPSEELGFFSCLNRQELSAECCNESPSGQCRAVCKAIFITESHPSRSQLQGVEEYCSSTVYQCVHNYTKSTKVSKPISSRPCCRKSSNRVCRERCHKILTSMTGEEAIVEELIKSCGSILPTEPLWQCFLSKSREPYPSRTRDTQGLDAAKLFCCHKATERNCRNLCVKTHSKRWHDNSNWSDFHTSCLFDRQETELTQCLAEVEEQCHMGCSGLGFCTNFNHRPAELFRSCNTQADKAAQRNYNSWIKGVISLPLLPDIHVKDIRQCHPEKWKAVACALQIKPCQRHVHASLICRSDCLTMLSECVDRSKLPRGRSVHDICEQLSPEDPDIPCVSVKEYAKASGHIGLDKEVTNPCKPNPCNASQVCMVNRRKCKHAEKCKPYICKPGCPLGDESAYFVPHSSVVRIPKKKGYAECYKMCRCGKKNQLHHCQDMGCVTPSICTIGRDFKAHNTEYLDGCNQCICYSGSVICSKRPCYKSSPSSHGRLSYTGLPCDCPEQFGPVCGVNGKTYPSACIARCSGLTDEQFIPGSCIVHDPCKRNPCRRDQRCVPRRRVCLNNKWAECLQYDCVSMSNMCNWRPHDPVCDTENQEHRNLCMLVQNNKEMAHFGHCLEGCSSEGTVCGVNGETYQSECTAWANKIPVDYKGDCQTVGVLPGGKSDPKCSWVNCPYRYIKGCQPITPPGACCPICAGEIRTLHSVFLTNQASGYAGVGAVTVQNVTELLSRNIMVQQCNTYGYLSIENDLVFIIAPNAKNPTLLQAKACLVETERLGSLLLSQNPTVTSHVLLSTLRTPRTRTAQITVPLSGSTSSAHRHFWCLLVVVILTTLLNIR